MRKKVLAMLLCITMTVGSLAGCGQQKPAEQAAETSEADANESAAAAETTSENDGYEAAAQASFDLSSVDTIKLGVLIYDSTDAEVVAFKNYYQNYIAQNFPVEFVYSEGIATAEEEVSAIENFINMNCKGIISFSDQDRVASIKLCEEAKVYYAVGAGTLSDEQYEELKGYSYYVGSIGPSLENEEVIGYDMAKHYIDAGYKNFLVYAGGYPYVDMHMKRTAGFIRAFEEAGVTYTPGDNGNFGTFAGDGYKIDTIDGFPDEAGAFFGTVGQKVGESDLEVVLTAALGVELFGASIAQINPEIKLATVASYTDAYKEAFNAEPAQLDYLTGKYASSIGPVFAAMFNAVTGNIDCVRDNGNAFRIDQGYWTAIGTEEFNTLFEIANSTEKPAYTADDLSSYIKLVNDAANFADFKAFAEAYTIEDIQALHK